MEIDEGLAPVQLGDALAKRFDLGLRRGRLLLFGLCLPFFFQFFARFQHLADEFTGVLFGDLAPFGQFGYEIGNLVAGNGGSADGRQQDLAGKLVENRPLDGFIGLALFIHGRHDNPPK